MTAHPRMLPPRSTNRGDLQNHRRSHATRSTHHICRGLSRNRRACTGGGLREAGRANPERSTSPGHPRPANRRGRRQQTGSIPPILGKTKAAEHAAIERLKAQHYTDKLPVDPAYSGAMFRGYGPRGPATVHSQSPSTRSDSGFDWGDAAIGAAAGLALTLLVTGGAMALSRRRSLRRGSANVATTA